MNVVLIEEKTVLNKLDGKVAIVTGAGSGIGRAIAECYADDASFMTGGYYPVDGGYLAE